jgi:hypothetical protein
MDWHVQYREDGTDRVARYASPASAIEAACRLIDDGNEVFGIGAGPLTIGKAEIDRIYAREQDVHSA